ncbi:MAG: deoxyguanosinetriphosphate triphosphohydrolase [Candidatus Riflebacteria bacterium]|nr:deoxyguanosinetriphosphate triphosphohydrolase [Candidatus Riflebacteria bacterium]
MQGITSTPALRLAFEENEAKTLSKFACLASKSRGREHPENDCYIRSCFQRDIDRIIHSESFRRLKHKTQVFLSPTNDHFRTRLTHTLEVVCTARCISRCLNLNEDLTEAIALAHDLGHTPFGHSGEEILAEISETGFHHASHGVRVVTCLEKNGQGLNLTHEVIDGILMHSKGRHGSATFSSESSLPLTVEAQVVRIADLVAYINHDIDDAIRASVITADDLPGNARRLLGDRHSVRIHTMVRDIIDNSMDSDLIQMSEPIREATAELKSFLYKDVYTRPEIDIAVQKSKHLLGQMAEWFTSHPDELLKHVRGHIPEEQSFNRTLVDYLASMTDDFALRRFQEIFVPHYYTFSDLKARKMENSQ